MCHFCDNDGFARQRFDIIDASGQQAAVIPIFRGSTFTETVVICFIAYSLSGCNTPAPEESKEKGAEVSIKIDQPLPVQDIGVKKSLSENIFDQRIEAPELSSSEFTRLYAEALSAAMPQTKVSITGPLNIAVRVDARDQHDCKVNLNKIWQSCKDKPGHREELTRPNVQAFYNLINFIERPIAGEGPIDKIVPLVRSKKFIEAAAGNRPLAAADLYYDKIFGDLYVVYAVDDPTATEPLSGDYLKNSAKTTTSALRDLSLRNLERIVARRMTLRPDGPIFIVSAGGSYEPSLLLLNKVVRNLAARVKGKLVVSVPSRDCLFICGDETPGALAKLKEVTDRAVAKAKLPISDKLYILDGGQWKEFKAFDSCE